MADYQRLITTEDIQRRYNLQGLESERKIIHTLNNNLTKTFGIIKNYIACTTSLESKEQYFYNGTPTLENYPVSEWDDLEDHLNTLYYNREEGTVYIFKYNSDDDYYYWEESNDSSLLTAMSVANSQADVSEDNLRRVFYEQPTVPYNVGDIWINGSKIYRCMRNETSESEFYFDDWIDYLEYTDDVATSNALRILGTFKETVETEYVTKTLLETTTDSITAEVSRVQTLAEGKSATYTEQPTPPYYRGDTYIKQVTDQETGITMNLIYVCQYSRLEGTYHEEDFAIQPGYATLSQIKVTNDAVTTTVAKVNGQDAKLSQMEQTVNEINSKIREVIDITTTAESDGGYVQLFGVNPSEPIEIIVIPRESDVKLLYPKSDLYPDDTLGVRNRKIYLENSEDASQYEIEIPYDLLYLNSEVYDEYILHYGENTLEDPSVCYIIKRVGVDSNGDKYELANSQIINLEYPHINLTEGDYGVWLDNDIADITQPYLSAYLKVTLMASNIYTTQFATRVEMNSAISQTAETINLEVNRRIIGFDENGRRTDDIFSSINLAPGSIKINANKIDIVGTINAINNDTSTTIDGDKITTGTINTAQLKANAITSDKIKSREITADKIAVGTLTANEIKDSTIVNSKIANGTIEGSKIKSATITNTNIANGTITGAKIENATITGAKIANATITDANVLYINASKIITGTMSADRIYGGTINGNNVSVTNLNASNITAGTLNVGRIPNLNCDKITAGTFSADRIPNLNAGKITAGTMSANRITGGTLQGSTIKATSGKIGCWNISSSNIHSSYVRFDNQNCVYIGSTTSLNSSWYNIVVAGRNASDKRLKKNVKQLQLNYDKFYDELKPIEFYYKKNADAGDKKHLGFIAQDIEKSLKENNISDMAMVWEDSGYYNLDKRELIALNVWQIQMLKKRVKELEEKLNGKTFNN